MGGGVVVGGGTVLVGGDVVGGEVVGGAVVVVGAVPEPGKSMGWRPMSLVSSSILGASTVRQSAVRTPPVSPELGFHAQYVQLKPFLPR